MDFNNTNQTPGNSQMPNGMPYQNYSYPPIRKSPADGLITASMVLGIGAVISAILMTVYFPFILGGISIVLALLSKGYENKMHSKSRTGIICSVIGIILNMLIVSWSFYSVFSNEHVFKQFDSLYEQFYGDSFSDMYKELTGEDFYLESR